jgi:hypothetical protein
MIHIAATIKTIWVAGECAFCDRRRGTTLEEMEDPTDKVQEDLHEKALEARQSWIMGAALTAALLAALAAVSSLLSGSYANEAMIAQIQASDQWSYYQAKGIKAEVLDSRLELLEALGKPPATAQDRQKLTEYRSQQEEVMKTAQERETESQHNLHHHVIFSRAVTLFQVAIAVVAISVLTRRRLFWYLGIIFGVVGVVALVHGLIG